MMSTFFGSAVYYAQYVLGSADYYAPISNYLSIAQIATLFVTPFLLKKFSKRTLMMTGIGTAALGWILDAGGFNAQLAAHNASSLNAINMSFAWIPAVAMLIAVICLAAFELDKKWDKVIADLSIGKHRMDA